jgi:hypothetical protein
VERAGKQAIRKGAPVMFGGAKPLSSKTKLTASTTGFDIVFDPYTVGGWTIAEHGTRPHPIRPRSAKALHWSGDRYTMAVAHPGTAGRKSWTKALKRLDAAVDPLIEDIYAEAITGA